MWTRTYYTKLDIEEHFYLIVGEYRGLGDVSVYKTYKEREDAIDKLYKPYRDIKQAVPSSKLDLINVAYTMGIYNKGCWIYYYRDLDAIREGYCFAEKHQPGQGILVTIKKTIKEWYRRFLFWW